MRPVRASYPVTSRKQTGVNHGFASMGYPASFYHGRHAGGNPGGVWTAASGRTANSGYSTQSNPGDADGDVHRDGYTDCDADRDCDEHCNCDQYADGNRHTNAHPDGYSASADSYIDGYHNANIDSDANSHFNSDTDSDEYAARFTNSGRADHQQLYVQREHSRTWLPCTADVGCCC